MQHSSVAAPCYGSKHTTKVVEPDAPMTCSSIAIPQELVALGDENIKLMELLEGRQVCSGCIRQPRPSQHKWTV